MRGWDEGGIDGVTYTAWVRRRPDASRIKTARSNLFMMLKGVVVL